MHCREGFQDKVELFGMFCCSAEVGWKLWFYGVQVGIYATSEHAVNYIWRGSGNVCMHLENANVSMTHIHALCPCTCNIVTLADCVCLCA